MKISDILKQRREQLNLTYEEIGKFVGVGKSTVRKWETGAIKSMGADKITLLSQILQISPIVFFETTNKALHFTNHEESLIKKYRQLDADGKRAVDDMIDFKLFQQSQKDSSTENKVG